MIRHQGWISPWGGLDPTHQDRASASIGAKGPDLTISSPPVLTPALAQTSDQDRRPRAPGGYEETPHGETEPRLERQENDHRHLEQVNI